MMQPWFPQAKLGVFIHWGIYAVNGIAESWSFYNNQISYDDYMKQCAGFTASKYDPAAWAALFKRAGANYAVLTAKHHDGVALWDTKQSDLSVVKKTPAGRDVLAPFCQVIRQQGMKVGIYFSHLDWSHPDYASIHKTGEGPGSAKPQTNPFTYNRVQNPDPAAWERFLQFHRAQIKELCQNFSPDLLWFDGDWERTSEQWRMSELRQQIHTWGGEQEVLNSRMGGHGDYLTPEQAVPIKKPQGVWEFCMTVNDSWGYQKHDQNHKSVRQLVRTFAEVIGMGGNLLLDVGPQADGSLQAEQVKRLEGLGDWARKHAEAIYPTTAGLEHGHLYGPSTLSADRSTLYAFVFDRPWDQFAIKGIRNTVKRVSVVGSGRELTHRKVGGAYWMNSPGVLWIDVPEDCLDENATVLKIELEGELDLYSGAGKAIEQN